MLYKRGDFMLIRFNVKNFLSFNEQRNGKTEEFSMLAGLPRNKKSHIFQQDKLSLLKFAAIYGANGSGKSNLVKAMKFMRHTILHGLELSSRNKYCRMHPDNKKKNTYFELEICLGKRYFAYGFEVLLSEGLFTSEWLMELFQDGTEKLIFTRDLVKKDYQISEEYFSVEEQEKLKLYADDVRSDPNALFLSVMNQNKKGLYSDDKYKKIRLLQLVYSWVECNLDIGYPEQPISNYDYMIQPTNMDHVKEVIRFFHTGITDFECKDIPREKAFDSLPDVICKDVKSRLTKMIDELKKDDSIRHEGLVLRSNRNFFIFRADRDGITCQTIQFCHDGVFFDMSEESDGTIRLLDLLEILLVGDGKTFIIDELDRCLHPSLIYKFIELYLETAKSKKVQLIVTTHESRLLDFNLLRRDEIWFINKDKAGESRIYSLEEYNERFDKKIDKAYLEGRYGGIPIFDTVFPIGE